MSQSTRTHLPAQRAALALAAALLGAGASAFAAGTDAAAFARAVEQIQAFPGRTAHGPGQTYVLRAVVTDANGSQHVRVDRLYKGLRVIGGEMVVHSNGSGAFVDATRTLQHAFSLDTSARIGAAQALAAATRAHGGDAQGATPELVVYARGDAPVLAYDVVLHGMQPDGTPSRLHVLVHANDGSLLDAWNDIKSVMATSTVSAGAAAAGSADFSDVVVSANPKVGTGKTLFSGDVPLSTDRRFKNFGKYSMLDSTRGGQKTNDLKGGTTGPGTTFTDADNIWGNNTTSDRATVGADAHYGVTLTWDYYLQVHGRNGIADDGKGAYNRVHYGTNYANAFWDDNCFCMTYGDGNAQWNPLTSIDVAGHEMSHGVTSRTAGLIYSGESGGLNEGTSDIMGTNVEFFANNPNDPGDYLIGEKIYKTPGGFLRSMIKPSVDGASSDCWYSTVGNLDVHYSSGVANHFYYLLAEGTTNGSPSPTCVAGNTRVATGTGTLAGIGRDKAEKIWYRALTVYMTPSTNYAAARAATINAANDLYGSGSPESLAVAAAWTAVNRP